MGARCFLHRKNQRSRALTLTSGRTAPYHRSCGSTSLAPPQLQCLTLCLHPSTVTRIFCGLSLCHTCRRAWAMRFQPRRAHRHTSGLPRAAPYSHWVRANTHWSSSPRWLAQRNPHRRFPLGRLLALLAATTCSSLAPAAGFPLSKARGRRTRYRQYLQIRWSMHGLLRSSSALHSSYGSYFGGTLPFSASDRRSCFQRTHSRLTSAPPCSERAGQALVWPMRAWG